MGRVGSHKIWGKKMFEGRSEIMGAEEETVMGRKTVMEEDKKFSWDRK